MLPVTAVFALFFVTIRCYSFSEADSYGGTTRRFKVIRRFNYEKPAILPVSVFVRNSISFMPGAVLFLPRLRKKLRKFFLAFIGGSSRHQPKFRLDYTQKRLERFVKFRRFNFFLRRSRKTTRAIQKVIGRKFFIPFGPIMDKLRIRHIIQRMVNVKIHEFLRYYKRRKGLLRVYGYRVRFRPRVSYKTQLYSKLLWYLNKRRRGQRRWLAKKKFSVLQQYRFYRKHQHFPILDKIRESYSGRCRRVLRKGSSSYSFWRFFFKLRKIADVLGSGVYGSIPLSRVNRSLKVSKFFETRVFSLQKNYFCLFLRRKRNNFYMTLVNGFGEVVLSLSSGAYLLKTDEKKRNKKMRASFKHFVDFLKFFTNKLKRKKVFVIKYFFRPLGMRRKFTNLLVYTFLNRSITVENILNVASRKHGLKEKNKKVRRL